jgi:hypothetical protein
LVASQEFEPRSNEDVVQMAERTSVRFHQPGRYIRRSDRIEWGRAVTCILAIFGLMVLVLAANDWRITAKQTDTRRDQPPSSASTHEEQQELLRRARIGKVLSPDGRNCRAMIFDNMTGQRHDGGITACDETNGKYDYPANRIKSIRDRFSKE